MSEPERITADEAAYVQALIEQENQQILIVQAPRHSYQQFLSKKYRLDKGDQIQPDGTITRKTPE